MIIDLEKFLADERPAWAELELSLKKLEEEPNLQLSLEQARRFHYLYQRASADLAALGLDLAHLSANLPALPEGISAVAGCNAGGKRFRRSGCLARCYCERSPHAVSASPGKSLRASGARRTGTETTGPPARREDELLERIDDTQHQGLHFHHGVGNDLGSGDYHDAVLQRSHSGRRWVGLRAGRRGQILAGLAAATRFGGNPGNPSGGTGRLCPCRSTDWLGTTDCLASALARQSVVPSQSVLRQGQSRPVPPEGLPGFPPNRVAAANPARIWPLLPARSPTQRRPE